jgi:hypothetical protein
MSDPTRVLVVANRTSSTPALLDEVRTRARSAPHDFTLLIPDVSDKKAADWTADAARPLLERAAGRAVNVITGGPEPFEAIRDTVRDGSFDEIIVSTLSKKTSKWLRRDLVRKVKGLGLPVTTIAATQKSLRAAVDDDDVTRGLGLAGGGGS